MASESPAHSRNGIRWASLLFFLLMPVIVGLAAGCDADGEVAPESAAISPDYDFRNAKSILPKVQELINEFTTNANPVTFIKAQRLLDRARKLDPENERVYLALGQLYMSAKFSNTIVEGLGGKGAVRKKVFAMFKTVLRINPNNAAAYEGLGQYYLKGNPRKALTNFMKAYELNPHWTTYHMIGVCYFELKKYDWAEEIFTGVLRQARAQRDRKSLVVAYEYLGRIGLKTGENDLAEKYLTESVAQFEQVLETEGSNRVCPYQALGVLYSKMGERSKSTENFIKAADFKPFNFDVQFTAAWNSLLNGEIKKALKYFKRGLAVADSPVLKPLRWIFRAELDSTQTLSTASVTNETEGIKAKTDFEVALTYFLDSEFDKVGPFLDSSSKIPPDRRLEVLRGFHLLIERQYVQADNIFLQVSAGGGFSPGAVAGLGHMSIVHKDYVTAKRLFAEVIDHLQSVSGRNERKNSDALYERFIYEMASLGMGWTLANQNMHVRAIEHFDFVLKSNPDNILALLGTANSLVGLHKLNEAQAHFEKVLKLQPENPYALATLGNVEFERGRMDKAEESFKAALVANPENYTCPYEGLGLVYFQRGQIGKAKENLQKAIELNPDIEYRKFNVLAQIYLREGRYAEAEALLVKSQENYPYDATAQNLLKELNKLKSRSDPPATTLTEVE
jgi:tetratricopeptide (TPR) repeat protein